MTERVDFYVLQSAAPKHRWIFACRLAEKAYLKDLRVLILAASAAEAKSMDELLWTFSDRSFVPHELCADAHSGAEPAPVRLTIALEGAGGADLLVNLSDRLPQDFERFARIAEVIDADPERRHLGRERFKCYREGKLALETHQLDESAHL